MVNEIVERVAEAIYNYRSRSHEWKSTQESFKVELRLMVKVAIAAMREPTEEMKVEGVKYFENDNLYDTDDSDGVWKLMIDAALKE